MVLIRLLLAVRRYFLLGGFLAAELAQYCCSVRKRDPHNKASYWWNPSPEGQHRPNLHIPRASSSGSIMELGLKNHARYTVSALVLQWPYNMLQLDPGGMILGLGAKTAMDLGTRAHNYVASNALARLLPLKLQIAHNKSSS